MIRLKSVILITLQLLVCTSILAQTTITSLSDITDPAGAYKLSSNFSTAGNAIDANDGLNIGTSTKPFTGTIDGALTPITGTWDRPLFEYIQDATIKNVIIESVSVSITSASTNAGAIASNAKGESRIYNCGILSGSVSGTKYVGGLVGQLHNTGTKNKGSHVVNCFSYADVSGGTDVAGIVGYNDFASNNGDLRTMVMNCMFYGDITTGTNISPVYGGTNIDNQKKLNTYNYYRYESNYSKNGQITSGKYNCALAVEDKHLTHFEYYRLLLNSNKKLAAWYASTSSTTVNPTDMAKWVLETADRTNNNPYPYPILKSQGKYPSIINFDDAHAPTLTLVNGKPLEADRNKGGKMGTLTVNIEDHTSGNGSRTGTFISTPSKTLPITDKDFDRFNYNYYKVRLPYFNEVGEGNYTDGKVVTGWIITGMTGATTTQAISGTELIVNNGVITTPYNFADRTCTKLEDGSYRVFSQGAYFDVPVGVTAITIQPYWANAAFLADSNLDISYDNKFSTRTAVAKTVYTNGQTYEIDGVSGLTVYTSFANAIGGIANKGVTVYDNAVVLVGNFHQGGIPYADKNVPFTVMSADFDEDNEPDFSFIYHHTDRKEISPIRFDFINVPGTAMAQKPNTSTMMCNAGIFKPYGWFELTNTALMRFGQFEYSFNDKTLSPTIFLGGEIEQIVSNNSGNGTAFTNKTSYFLLGGNVWFKEFNNGTHSDKTQQTPHRPISVSGGRFEKFYLSGIYQPKVDAMTDNAECYISGGSFGEVAGAGQEQIKGNVYWKIDYADIDNFYGGGINAAKPVTGNIDVIISNSWVDVYCGGPKFGDMGSGKTVKTLATDCVFRRFFGAGYGGNSYNRIIVKTAENSHPWGTWDDEYTNNRGKYSSGNNGIPTSFEYEYFIGSKGTIWGRFYVNYASFSKATVHNVTSELTGCEITGDFYGGGCLGVVDGTATSILDGCSVLGSVFGGGYSATIPNIDVMTGGFVTIPGYNSSAGIFTPAVFPGTQSYEWETHAVSNGNSALGTGTIYTTEDLTNLGVVSNVNLTITGNTYVKGDIHTYDEKGDIDDTQTVTGGGVFGGGDASSIGNNTIIVIDNTSAQNQKSILNVFGGGNQAGVIGSTNVTLASGTVIGGIYGGCNADGSVGPVIIALNGGTAGTVYGGGFGSATTTTDDIGVTLNGSTINGDIYGGSALGSVNLATASPLNTTTINLLTATLHGRVFGGGMGDNNTTPNPTTAISNGNAVININIANPYLTGIYGGANINGLVNGNIDVNVNANVGSTGVGNGLDIFGGGYGANTNTNGNVTVTIGSLDGTYAPTIYGDIYGGSALGNVNDDATDLTKVDFLNGTLHGNIYGGGLGQRSPTPIAAKVNGQVLVNIGANGQNNCAIDLSDASVFGCNNTNGSPQDNVTVNIYCTAHNTQYGIDQVFGGGNQADYAPENGLATSTKRTTVNVIGCLNTIRRVFGGGNAAAALGVVTVIDGGTFDQVFGGGNGETSAANIGAGGTNLTVHGGTINQLFGGSNTSGIIYGPMNTLVDGTGDCAASMNIAEFFCGNNLANIGTQENPTIINATIGCGTIFGDVYGGCSLADIYGDITLNIEGGTINRVFGGSKGDLASLGTGHIDKAANIAGNVTLNITGGSIGSAFGGSNIYGNITGSILVNVEKDTDPCIWNIGNIYGASNDAAYTPTAQGNSLTVNIKNGNINGSVYGGGKGSTATVTSNPIVTIGDNNDDHFVTVTGNVYGGGDEASVIGNTSVTLISGNVNGGVYGGCNNQGSVGDVTIALNGGTVGASGNGNSADVYGGGYGSATATTGNIGVTLNGTTVYGDIYGGSALGGVNTNTDNTAIVTLSTATLYGSVFGGGKGDNSTTAISNGNTIVNINIANTNLTGIYGGANIRGNIKGSTAVNINANVGAQGNDLDIFGGGYGANTNTEGNVTVTIGDVEGNYTPTIYGDIYGGSALGNVNNDANDITKVDFLNGTLHGNLYGGGLGDKESLGSGHSDVAAKVYGQVEVNIGAAGQSSCAIDLSNASVFGCNNTNGSPQDNVTVNVYCTGHDAKNAASYTGSDATYAIDQVFGGGNQADYAPEDGLATSTKKATVNVIGCLNTIRRVFGGGNAAAAVGVSTNLYGGRYDYVFGGGNGEVTAANIGDGGTDLNVHGCNINHLFGGSNANGNISGNMGVNVDNTGGCQDDMFIAEFFCGNNLADIGTQDNPIDINATIGCGTVFGDLYGGCNLADIHGNVTLTIEGGTMNNVYGGSKGRVADQANNITAKAADIYGDVTLNITGGSIGNAFGGSNINGNIKGSITVNVEKAADPCLWEVGNVYGGSNLATYTPTTPGAYPEVNIKNGTITHSVYGGGKGSTATVTSNPKVTVGDANADYCAIVSEDVYGGGDAATVIGTPVVYVINKANTSIGNVYGGGNAADVSATSVTIDGGTITGDVYGGGHGDKASLNNGQDQSHTDKTANVNGNVSVTVTGGTINRVFGGANTNGSITGASAINVNKGNNSGDLHISELYGGGNMAAGNAGTITIGCTGDSNEGIDDVYGGANQADIGNNINLNITGGSIQHVFGGNNTSGTITGTIAVTVNWDTQNTCGYNYLGSVIGGGNRANYPGTPLVTITNGIVHNVYGGGNQADVAGATVNMNGGSIINGIYGGCNTSGTVTGDITVNINGGTVGTDANNTANIHGGGFGESTGTSGNVEVTIGTAVGAQTYPTIYGDVYGGSALGKVNGTTLNNSLHTYVTLNAGTINGSLYGGALGAAGISANVYAPVTVTVNGGTVTEGVYGCNNVNGAPQGTVTVNINATDQPATGYNISNVFGGGNQAAYTGNATVRLINGTISNDVYGGGRQADVNGSTNVTIEGGTVTHDVYGGGMEGNVVGSVTVNIGKSDGSGTVSVGHDVYGGGALAHTNMGNLNNDQTITTNRYTTLVYLYRGATIGHDVYGGGRGQKVDQANGITSVEALVYGDVTVLQKGAVLIPDYDVNGLAKSGRIFGCNNVNGTPKGHVLVNVELTNPHSSTDRYDLAAVYGGGNEAEYYPYKVAQDDSENTEVIINGCDNVSIHSVYGGGNAASTPATDVKIRGAKEIEFVYGGGNGAAIDGQYNPGANVGYTKFSDDISQPDKVAERANYIYGSGLANTEVYGGTIHHVFGGSNTKGNVRKAAVARLEELGGCPLVIDEIYGGGRAAFMDGSASLELGCISGLDEIYGGSERADIGKDIELTITSGKFNKVFGGNNVSGRIFGSIKVNIEQTGCLPIEIGELYGGGNKASYSVYGYNGNNLNYELQPGTTAYRDPEINIKSFKSIETVYGGGYQAEMVGNPHININVVKGWTNGEYKGKEEGVQDDYAEYKDTPKNMDSMGEIGDVFGGGNEADVYGKTYINIGTESEITVNAVTKQVYNIIKANRTDITDPQFENTDADTETKNLTITVQGAIINGNVFGGGNQADVTEGTNITVGPDQ